MRTRAPTLGRSIRGVIEGLLVAAPIRPAFRRAVAAALELDGNILSDTPNLRWASIARATCIGAGGTDAQVVPLAAAIEIHMVALDLLDDAEDEEPNSLSAHLGPARCLNVSTGLLFLAQTLILRVEHGNVAAGMLLDASLQACSGQDADLTPYETGEVDFERAQSITAEKSATLVSAVCRLGAFAAGAVEDVGQAYAMFGWNVGMTAQLVNDLVALHPEAVSKTDIRLGRPTVPRAFAAYAQTGTPPGDAVEQRQAGWLGGAGLLTWAVAETYRRRALDMVPHLTRHPHHRRQLEDLFPRLTKD